MADLTLTPASVLKGSSPQTGTGIAAQAITAGQTLYADPTTTPSGQLRPALAGGTLVQSQVVGIALNNAAAGQPVTYQSGGTVTVNAVLLVGKTYVQSANAGMIAPIADLVATNYTTLLGVATSTTSLLLAVNATGAQN